MGEERLTGPEDLDGSGASVARARARQMRRRLPLFAAVWLGVAVGWSIVLCLESLLTPLLAVPILAVQAAVIGGAIAIVRAEPAVPGVLPVVMAACVFLGTSTIVVFARVAGSGDFLAYVLLTLYLSAALAFMWGWPAELGLLVATVIPWLLAIPALRFHFPTAELVTAIVTGSVISLAIAEAGARNLEFALRHRANEERSRRELEASRDAYRDLAEHAHELILTADPSGRFTYVNAALAHHLGEPAEALLGRPVSEFLSGHPANRAIRDLLSAPAETGAALPLLEFEARTVRGLRWLETVPSVVRDPDGSCGGIRAICRDVTEREQLERERDRVMASESAARIAADRARAEAEAATLARDRFLATLSHELRSPLSAVLTWTGMLRRGLVSEERVPNALASIESAARAQVRLVEDLLDISRIAAGKVSLQLEAVDLAAILAARAEVARAAATVNGITLDVRLDAMPGPVRGDPARLNQVFENLLSNAIKFTPGGGHITLALERADGTAQVTVSDTGIGIPAHVLPHVFDQFQQADSSITRRYGGLGLGLAIARRLVEMHGGSIEAESAGAQRGATFRVRLPLAPRPAVAGRVALSAGSPHAPLPTLDHLRVLVVDDEPDAREVLSALLAACGAEVGSAASVREALERVETEPPDVLLTDIAMPDEDGYALIREIRSRGSRIPAIAITALASAEDRARAMAEGFDAHLTKPVDPAEVVEAVARSVAGRA